MGIWARDLRLRSLTWWIVFWQSKMNGKEPLTMSNTQLIWRINSLRRSQDTRLKSCVTVTTRWTRSSDLSSKEKIRLFNSCKTILKLNWEVLTAGSNKKSWRELRKKSPSEVRSVKFPTQLGMRSMVSRMNKFKLLTKYLKWSKLKLTNACNRIRTLNFWSKTYWRILWTRLVA